MLVRQILQTKGQAGVLTVAPSATVSEAAEILSAKRIGGLVVSENGTHALGIISERDIVREVGKRGPTCLSETVSEMMTRNLVTCSCDERSDEVLSKMTEGRFRHLPVIEDGEMVGLITIGDVVKARLSELAMEKDALEGMIMGH